MSDNKESKPVSWADLMELEDLADTLPNQGGEEACQEPNNQAPGQKKVGGPRTPNQRREGGPQTSHQRGRGGNQPHYQREDGGHRTPYQRRDGGHQTTHPRGREGYQGQRGGQDYNHQAPYKPGYQRPSPQYNEDASLRTPKQVPSLLLKKEAENTRKTKVVQGQEKIEESERDAYEREIKQLKEELKHLNPNYKVPQDMFYYHLKTKEELLGVVSAQIKKLAALSSGSRPEETQRAEAEAPKQEVNNTTVLHMGALDHQLREKEKANQEMRKKIAELQALVGSLNEQLQNERQRGEAEAPKQEVLPDLVYSLKTELQEEKLRAETFRKERDEFSLRLQETSFQALDLCKKKEVEKVSLEEKVKALQEELTASASNHNNQVNELLVRFAFQNKQLENEMSRAADLQKKMVDARRQVADKEQEHLELRDKTRTAHDTLEKELQVLKTEALRRDEENRATVQDLETKLKEKETSCFELASELKQQEEVSQALQEEVKELQKALKDQKSQEKTKPSLSVNCTQEGSLENIVQETSEAVQTTPGMVEESPVNDEVTPVIVEDSPKTVEESPEMVEVIPVVVILTPKAAKVTTDIVEDTPAVEDSAEIVEDLPTMEEVTTVLDLTTSEVERVSLWRRFKKTLTPHSRRQYKHLPPQRRQRRHHDENEA